MRKYFLNIIKPGKKLKLNKRLSAVFICFAAATVFWFLIALSKEYTASLSFPVVYNNLPGQKVVVNDLPFEVILNIRTSGFKILSYRFRKKKEPVQIDVESRIGKSFSQADDVMVIPTKTFTADFNEQLGSEVNIISFVPDSIPFNFSYKSLKRVPVKADVKINFDKQYDSIGVPSLQPESVYISGPATLIEETKTIFTEAVFLEKIKEPVKKKVRLTAPRLISLSDTIVKLTIPVEKFTEENIEIPVIPVHVQKGYLLKTFPDKINVRFQVALSHYSQVSTSSFAAVVDAGKLNDSKVNKMHVELIYSPPFIKSIVIEPERVDYILRKQ